MREVQIELKKNKPDGQGIFTPAQMLALGFIAVIFIGAALLSLPYSSADGKGLPFIDALFTSTSAVCVTGLVVVDTGTYFSAFGQLVILLLIEIGGLGFMTFATLFAILLGRKITLKERILLQEALNQLSLEGIVRLAKHVMKIAFVIQATGAVLLSLAWWKELGPGRAVYYGIFHAVSAFNNAGFDLFGDFRSLEAYAGDIMTNLVVAALIITGGLGFVVLAELYAKRKSKLSLHSHLVIIASAALIIFGTFAILILEYSNPKTLALLEPQDRVLASFFQAVTPRTAGFSTLPISGMRDTTLLVLIVYMFIGAAPGSTGGGIKVTTFVSLAASVAASFKGKVEVVIGERALPPVIIQKAVAVALSALVLVLVVTGVLTMTEEAGFLPLLFEAVSAFGTVGLSTGVTPQLTAAGKTVIIFTMYAGRIGPVTLAYALAQKRKISLAHIKYPEEKILIG
ncbi:MAG: TrkH family potassium uptake protein [Peptococcaceae bacterium]|nr:TrkH family potassium uptake protein [Peptococcaceae bacterium]MDH7525405.1 TrkH family potassium uptake protein [Peptococcaceae bacterium]